MRGAVAEELGLVRGGTNKEKARKRTKGSIGHSAKHARRCLAMVGVTSRL